MAMARGECGWSVVVGIREGMSCCCWGWRKWCISFVDLLSCWIVVVAWAALRIQVVCSLIRLHLVNVYLVL